MGNFHAFLLYADFFFKINIFGKFFQEYSTLVKGEQQKNNCLISQPKHMLWVLKRSVSLRRDTKHMLKIMEKEIFTIL